MALGRQGERQADLMLSWAELPRSPGHAFYDRLQAILVGAGFDGFAEEQCAPYHAGKRGRPSIPPGRYFRVHLVGYFEGIDSERGLGWRCSDGLSLREFLRLGTTGPVPDHSWPRRPPREGRPFPAAYRITSRPLIPVAASRKMARRIPVSLARKPRTWTNGGFGLAAAPATGARRSVSGTPWRARNNAWCSRRSTAAA